MRTYTVITSIVGLLALLALGSNARADRMDELQARFKQRFAQLKELKKAGVIGETAPGKVEAVKGKLEDENKKVVAEENADRTELYELIAKKEGATPAAVAERNAIRNFQKAAAGEYLKGKDGQWRKKGA
jgi:uncharacterized protein YdbL (DUF1318 family)